MKKESLTTKKVVSLSERRLTGMTEDELLAHVIDQLVDQTNQLVLAMTQLSMRLSSVEDAVSSSSEQPLFDVKES